MKRRILIATPIKGGVSSSYMTGFVPTIMKEYPDLELTHYLHDGASVNFARNDLADFALRINAREIVFVDEDMAWNTEMFDRLISHEDVDIVAGIYCKKKPGKPFWLLNAKPGAEIDPKTQLCEVLDIATGFMKIRVDTVLKTMQDRYPELQYENVGEAGQPEIATEFFPMGIEGPRTATRRLAKIRDLIAGYYEGGGLTAADLVSEIEQAIVRPEKVGTLRGEDYMFCYLARQCGFKVYADFGLPPIGHWGKVIYPITPEKIGLDPAKRLAELNQAAA